MSGGVRAHSCDEPDSVGQRIPDGIWNARALIIPRSERRFSRFNQVLAGFVLRAPLFFVGLYRASERVRGLELLRGKSCPGTVLGNTLTERDPTASSSPII